MVYQGKKAVKPEKWLTIDGGQKTKEGYFNRSSPLILSHLCVECDVESMFSVWVLRVTTKQIIARGGGVCCCHNTYDM